MTRPKLSKSAQTKAQILRAAQSVLLESGFSGLSTRRVADVLGTPMSQIQYHFGSKEGMILALFEDMNARLVDRQKALFEDPNLLISQQWDMACDYLDDDISSGYVGIVQELIAAGWSNPKIGAAVSEGLDEWQSLLTQIAQRSERTLGRFAFFSAEEIAALVSVAFLGAEAQILLGRERNDMPIRKALRRVGDAIRALETAKGAS
jgi:AcrR family transcriptional regulator